MNKSSILVFSSVSMILLLSLSASESFAYSTAFSGHNVKSYTSSYKTKPTHLISISFVCDSGTSQSVSFRIYQLNIRNGFDKTINLDSTHTRITLSLPDGGYLVMASGHITTGGGSIMVEGQTVFAVNGKDKSVSIKLTPLEGMA